MPPEILNKDYTITAEITIREGGAEGMIVTMGGRFGGYGLFLQYGKPVFVYNMLDLERFRWEGGIGGRVHEDWFGKALKPGKAHHRLRFQIRRSRTYRPRLEHLGVRIESETPNAGSFEVKLSTDEPIVGES